MPAVKKTSIEISTSTLFKVLAIFVAVVFLYYIRDILILVFVALILSSAIDPWVDWFQKYKVPRSLSVFFIYTLAAGFIFFSVFLLISPLTTEIGNLSDDLPMYWQKLSFGWHEFQIFSQSHGLQQSVADAIKSTQNTVTALATNVFGVVFSFVGGIFSVLVVLVITFYLVVYDQSMKRKIRSFLPIKYQPYSTHLINRIQEKIGLWLRGQLILSLIIFVFSLVGLSLLGVKYAWVLALLSGVSEIIPYFGPIIGGGPAIFIAFTQSPALGLFTFLLYILIHQSENYLIVPQVMKRAVGLNPVIVVVAMLVGAKVAGIAGIVLAIPVTTALSVVFGDIMLNKKSGFSALNNSVEEDLR
jgi:predicted PurR-regulated permease PerM